MYMVVCMHLYNFGFVQAFICACVPLSFFHGIGGRLLTGCKSNYYFQFNRSGNPRQVRAVVCVVRVAVGDSSLVECRQWSKYYQTGKTVHVRTILPQK